MRRGIECRPEGAELLRSLTFVQGVRSVENQPQWLAADWWQKEIAEAVSVSDPTLCNLRITLAHYRLSRVLHEVTGKDSGANFHTWAVWGSKKAGETIRQE